MESLDQKAVPFLVFWGNSILFYTVAAGVFIPTNSALWVCVLCANFMTYILIHFIIFSKVVWLALLCFMGIKFCKIVVSGINVFLLLPNLQNSAEFTISTCPHWKNWVIQWENKTRARNNETEEEDTHSLQSEEKKSPADWLGSSLVGKCEDAKERSVLGIVRVTSRVSPSFQSLYLGEVEWHTWEIITGRAGLSAFLLEMSVPQVTGPRLSSVHNSSF